MAAKQLELLSPGTHAELRMRPWNGNKPHFVQIIASEFASAAVMSPILATKEAETGKFYVGALFGFKAGEDLTILPGEDRSSFLPLDLARQGFYISGEEIAIDPASTRFSAVEGEFLFDDAQQGTDALRQIQRALGMLKAGVDETDRFLSSMLQHRLLEPIDISLKFDDGETLVLDGLYTVSLDALSDLDDAAALSLFRQGYLQLAFCMIGSLKQIAVLAQRRNRRLSQQAQD